MFTVDNLLAGVIILAAIAFIVFACWCIIWADKRMGLTNKERSKKTSWWYCYGCQGNTEHEEKRGRIVCAICGNKRFGG